MKNNSKVSVSCDVRLNKYEVIPHKMEVRKQIAYVPQEDSIQATSTPREAIYFSAKLRLPRHTSEDHLKTLTNEMITELGLSSCADTIIGGNLEKGISGGERKRTSVGVELVVRPALVFLDEPTSGKYIICMFFTLFFINSHIICFDRIGLLFSSATSSSFVQSS